MSGTSSDGHDEEDHWSLREQPDGWDEPLDGGDTQALAWLEPKARDVLGQTAGEELWGQLARPLAEAVDALSRLDVLWDTQLPELQAGLLERVVWAEAVAAYADSTPTGGRRDAFVQWLWSEGLTPVARNEGSQSFANAMAYTEVLADVRGMARGMGSLAVTGGVRDFEPDAGQKLLSEHGAFRRVVRIRTDDAASLEAHAVGEFDPLAWQMWRDGLFRSEAPPLAAWVEATWNWRKSRVIPAPSLENVWTLGTAFMRAQGSLRAAPLPVWQGLDKRRRLLAETPAAHARVLLHGVTAAARAHRRTLENLTVKDAEARRWIAKRRAGGAAQPIWNVLLRVPAMTALRMSEAIGITAQAATRVMVEMWEAGLIREVSGRESWRVWTI
jgi:hypothetical protein